MTHVLEVVNREVTACRRCPRLVEWRERVAREKRASFKDQSYWGKPVPAFGDRQAWLLIVGLAPAAHGANRTGRMFTGDRSGDWLYRALHRAGLASQAESVHRDDGLSLRGCYVTAAVRCAPPDNKPTPSERDQCRPYLEQEIRLLDTVRVVVVLGSFAWSQSLRILTDAGWGVPRPRPKFGHGVEVVVEPPVSAAVTAGQAGKTRTSAGERKHAPRPPLTLLASYHPSQQNTFTGRLTEEMFDSVWARAVRVGPARDGFQRSGPLL